MGLFLKTQELMVDLTKIQLTMGINVQLIGIESRVIKIAPASLRSMCGIMGSPDSCEANTSFESLLGVRLWSPET